MVTVKPLYVVTITAVVTAYYNYEDEDGPAPTRKDRVEHRVVYVAPSKELATAFFTNAWDDRKPEIKNVSVVPVDAIIQVTVGR
jgi:hypothetical protein